MKLLFVLALWIAPPQTSPSIARIVSLVEAGQWKEAESECQAFLARTRDSGKILPLFDWSETWEREFRFDRSVWLFGQLLAANPKWDGNHQNYANALRRAGRYEESETAFQAGIFQFPKLGRLHNDLALLFQAQGRVDAAEEQFAIAVEMGDLDAAPNLAMLRLQRKNDPGSLEAIEQALRLQPRNTWARRLWAIRRLDPR